MFIQLTTMQIGELHALGLLRVIIIIILWAGVQPTLDPYAEAFIAGPLR